MLNLFSSIVMYVVDRVLYYHPNQVITVNGKRQKVWFPALASDGTPCTTSRNQRGVRLILQRYYCIGVARDAGTPQGDEKTSFAGILLE